MARRVAVICVLALALAASARAQSGSSGTSTGQSSTTTQTPSSSTDRRRKRGRRRRRSSATLGCGLCRPPRCSRNGKWSASGYRRGTNWVQGYTNVADFAGTFAVGIERPRRDLRLVPRRHAHRSRHPADLRATIRRSAASSIAIRRSTSTGPATTSATSTSARRYNLCRSPARTRRRSRCAAWSSCRPAKSTPASAPARPTSRSTASSARKRRSSSKCRATAATNGAASPDGFDTPGGAFRWGTGAGVPVAQLPAGRRRVERLRAVERHGDASTDRRWSASTAAARR